MAESRRQRVNPNDTDAAGVVHESNKIPGRPLGSNLPQEKRNIERKEIMFLTPKGKVCKNIYEIFRTKSGTHRRLVQTIKNVKG